MSRVKSALSIKKGVTVISLWDSKQSWQSASTRVGIPFDKINFISNNFLSQFDFDQLENSLNLFYNTLGNFCIYSKPLEFES